MKLSHTCALNFNYILEFFMHCYAYQEVTRAHKGWALDSVVLQNQITRYNKEDIHDPPTEGKKLVSLFTSVSTFLSRNLPRRLRLWTLSRR